MLTSPEYREDVWNKTIEAADAASDYASGVAEDPQKLVNDVSDGIDRVRDAVSEAYADYKRAEAEAIAEGRAAEFYGNIAGHGLVEVGSTVVPVGAAAKLSKVSKFAKAVDKAEDLTDAVPGGPISAKQKARLAQDANKDVPDTPCAAAATTKCPSNDTVRTSAATSSLKNKIDYNHIINGEVKTRSNGSLHAVGGHSLKSNNVKLKQIISSSDRSGVKRATIEIRNLKTGRWVEKKLPSTLFPDDWSSYKIQNEIESAFKNSKRVIGSTSKWRGKSDGGVLIEGVIMENGEIPTAYPVYKGRK